MSGAAVAAIVAKARRRIANHFLDAHATSKGRAVPFEPRDHLVDRRLFRRMVEFGAVKEAEPGRYWLDEGRYADMRKERLARMLGIMAIAGFAVAGAIAWGG